MSSMSMGLTAAIISATTAEKVVLPTCDEQVGSVVVVGAGFAGLISAYALQLHGCTQVTVLESRNRIGGRAYTLGEEYRELAGIDVGAHWVVAGKNNPITSTLAKLLDVELQHVGGDDDYQFDRDQLLLFDDDGQKITPVSRRETDSSFDLMNSRLQLIDLLDSKRFSNKLKDITVAEALRKETAGLNYSTFSRRLQSWHDQIYYDDNSGAKAENLSLAAFCRCDDNADAWYNGATRGYEGGAGDAIVVGGFAAIEDKLAAKLNIRLNTAVTKVVSREIPAAENSGKGSVVITAEHTAASTGGESGANTGNVLFHADRVIVTVPLGVLKAGKIAFTPSLGKRKQAAIENFGYGSVGKLILGYDKIFWPQEYYGFGIAKEGWHHIVNHAMEFEQQNVTRHRNTTTHKVLDFYIGGRSAIALEQMSLQQAVDYATGILQKMFGSDNRRVPVPVTAYKTDWHTNEWSQGTWSTYTLGSKCTDPVHLSTPMANDTILFAGEATCQKLQGDTHSAIVSGLREAYRLLGNIANSSLWPMFDPKIRTLCEELLYPGNDDDAGGDDDRPASARRI